MIKTLTGNNSFQVNASLRKILDDFKSEHGDLALEKIDGEEAEYSQIIGAVESLPFLAAKKMVVVHDLSLNKQASESLERIVELAGDTTDLVIVETKPDKRSTYYKQLKKITDFDEFNEPGEGELAGWLISEAKKSGAEITQSDANYLIQRVGANQMHLSKEIEKLSNYDKKISRKTIDLLTEDNPQSNIFNLVDAIFSGNTKRALQIYDEQRKQKVEPQAIAGMLVWQMHAVAIASVAPSTKSANDIAKDSGLSPYVIQKSQRIADKMGRAKIIEFMKLLRELDYRSKHEVLDYDEALRYAILALG